MFLLSVGKRASLLVIADSVIYRRNADIGG
jgi:hypothetical protein